MSEIKVCEVEEYSQAFSGAKAYRLEIGKDFPFAFFYADATGCTIAWDGAINFKEIEAKAISLLFTDQLLTKSEQKKFLVDRSRTEVSFVLQNHKESFVEYQLWDSEQYNTYARILDASEEILFARYDINIETRETPPKPLTYSFTAENPIAVLSEVSNSYIFNSSREIAIRVPWVFPFFLEGTWRFSSVPSDSYLRPDYLIHRIIRNHYSSNTIEADADIKKSISTLNNLIKDNAKRFVRPISNGHIRVST